MELLYKDITEQIIGAAFEVYRHLGYGFLEKVYQRAMKVELELRDLKAETSEDQSSLQGDDRWRLPGRYLRSRCGYRRT